MLNDTVIILANMRGGYVNVGSTVHTLFRMNRRPRNCPEQTEVVEAVAGSISFVRFDR